MRHIYNDTIKAFAAAIDAKDVYTKNHSFRVAKYAVAIAGELGWKEKDVEAIYVAGLLHDIGKITIDRGVINKGEDLSVSELSEIKRHPQISYDILSKINFPWKDLVHFVKHHHERIDGRGYPDSLQGEELSDGVKILAIADAFDAMSRAYSYVISRPKQFILYCIINTSYGLLCLALVAFVAWLMIKLSFCTVGLGMGQKFSAVQSFISQKSTIACLGFCTAHLPEAKTTTVCLDHWSLKFLAGMLIIYVTLIKLAVWSFVITYWLSAKTIIYFLLRKEIDSTDVTDVYIEEITQEEKKPEISGKENEKLPQ